MRFRRVIPAVIVAVAATMLLTACPGPAPAPPTPAPTDVPDATVLADEVAFVITVSFESPGGGETMDATITVEAPTQADAEADAAAFAASVNCPPGALLGTSPAIATPAYLHLTVET